MICREFPDLHWLKAQAERRFENRQGWGGRTLTTQGWPSVVLNVHSGTVKRDDIRGPLSFFANLSGKSRVGCGNRSTVVDDRLFYVTNHDQYYTLEIDEADKTETLNVHFGEYWADEALATLSRRPEDLLDNSSFIVPEQRFEMHNRLHIVSPEMRDCLLQLKDADEATQRDELLYALLVQLLCEDKKIKRAALSLPAARVATRKAIIDQLNIVCDYVHSHYEKPISLDDLAGIACMSKFHFLRLFKIAYGITPQQFIQSVKIDRAKALLRDQETDVRLIALALGFNTSSTFSRAFYKTVGCYPTQYRASI